MAFVHLHVHSQYSLLDGACTMGDKKDKMMELLEEMGQTAIAITDHGNMYASLYFAEECVKKGIKYIIGCELYATDDYLDKRPGTKTHGHTRNVKRSPMAAMYAAKEYGAQVLLFGHTHVPLVDNDGSLLTLNPGAAGDPLHPTCGVLTIENGRADVSTLRL